MEVSEFDAKLRELKAGFEQNPSDTARHDQEFGRLYADCGWPPERIMERARIGYGPLRRLLLLGKFLRFSPASGKPWLTAEHFAYLWKTSSRIKDERKRFNRLAQAIEYDDRQQGVKPRRADERLTLRETIIAILGTEGQWFNGFELARMVQERHALDRSMLQPVRSSLKDIRDSPPGGKVLQSRPGKLRFHADGPPWSEHRLIEAPRQKVLFAEIVERIGLLKLLGNRGRPCLRRIQTLLAKVEIPMSSPAIEPEADSPNYSTTE